MYGDLFRQGEVFTVGSEFMRQRVLDLGAPADRVIKLPLGVDISRFKYCWNRGVLNEFRLLTVARLVEVKGIEYALRAVALIRACVPELRYTIAGDGPLRPMLEALARGLRVDDIVTFKGAVSQEEAERLFAEAHTFVLPGVVTAGGEQEGQSLVIAEAQACGIPVVATSVGGVPESLRNGETGMLVPPRDPRALGSALVRLARDGGTRQRMGREGRTFVESHFNLNIQNKKLMEIYSSCRC
jgi:colanic acid/amylovoran biosynthesis glycosyltransferase